VKFGSYFNIVRGASDDWFDVDLVVDTKLFVDPFLLLDEPRRSPWVDAHGELLRHFTRCYDLIAKGGSPSSLSAQTAHSLLKFPEPHELGLGYTEHGRRGQGGGDGRARQIANSIATAIAAGLTKPEHIEEIGILNEGIGADGISDAACNVLKARLIAYTKDVAARHQLPTAPHRIRNARVDLTGGRWISEQHELPPSPDGDPVILVPARFLNHLPVLNADDWFDSTFNKDVRRDMNVRVGQKVRKKDIVKAARKHPDRIREWADYVQENGLGAGYDFEADPLGVTKWQEAGATFAAAHPLQRGAVTTQQELRAFVEEVLGQFRHFVEQQGGWSLLWARPGVEKPEEAAQLLLLGVARPYCRLHGVEIDREVEMGRGPVDFKVSRGSSVRALIEVKKLHNGKFWNGLEQQLPTYMRSDSCDAGWLLAVRYKNKGVSAERARELPKRVERLAKAEGLELHCQLVDARRPKSASKL